jgi:hypothetical protein
MSNIGSYATVNNIVAAILVIVGLIWIIHSLWRNWKICRINTWPKTNAFVLNAMAAPANQSAGNTYVDPKYITPTINDSARYIPIIIYRYRIGDRDYQSDKVVYSGPKSYSTFDTKTIMGNISNGSIIPIYYNPRNPKESYIYVGTTNYLGIIIGIVLILIAIYIGYRGNFNKPEGQAQVKKNGGDSNTTGSQTSKTNGIPITPFTKSYFRNFIY